ncbi:hypothetical protein HII31_09054 [Pseudocercospora fuligena]|uniref:Uncharacterized protein n=1 Tax=Pseudocercospora fuligena TaxID=685502 RepID=A0A8H6VFL1_9PEZI|nr:hypothetical protein HII31_09054 [Pseudocercospora fuligena]
MHTSALSLALLAVLHLVACNDSTAGPAALDTAPDPTMTVIKCRLNCPLPKPGHEILPPCDCPCLMTNGRCEDITQWIAPTSSVEVTKCRWRFWRIGSYCDCPGQHGKCEDITSTVMFTTTLPSPPEKTSESSTETSTLPPATSSAHTTSRSTSLTSSGASDTSRTEKSYSSTSSTDAAANQSSTRRMSSHGPSTSTTDTFSGSSSPLPSTSSHPDATSTTMIEHDTSNSATTQTHPASGSASISTATQTETSSTSGLAVLATVTAAAGEAARQLAGIKDEVEAFSLNPQDPDVSKRLQHEIQAVTSQVLSAKEHIQHSLFSWPHLGPLLVSALSHLQDAIMSPGNPVAPSEVAAISSHLSSAIAAAGQFSQAAASDAAQATSASQSTRGSTSATDATTTSDAMASGDVTTIGDISTSSRAITSEQRHHQKQCDDDEHCIFTWVQTVLAAD